MAAAQVTTPVIIESYPTQEANIHETDKEPLPTTIAPGKIFPKSRLSLRRVSGKKEWVPLEFVKTIEVPRTVATTVAGVVDGRNHNY